MMGQGHDHARAANKRGLKIALSLTGLYLVAEVAGGIATNSLALLSDAAHMLTDVVALAIALLAIRIAERPADRKRTFGYHRFEILAASFNAIALLIAGMLILYEAWKRFFYPPDIQTGWMSVVAGVGLIVNIISMFVLRGGKEHSLNMKGAYLEVWSDMLGSVAVIVGAALIYVTDWKQIDPILAVLIGLWVIPRTWSLLSSSINILLEGVPEGLNLEAISESLKKVEGVLDVHDLHVWAITSGKNTLTVHLVTSDAVENEEIQQNVSRILASEFALTHTTIQLEAIDCNPNNDDCFSESAEYAAHSH